MHHLKWLVILVGICTCAGESLGLLLMQLKNGAGNLSLTSLLPGDFAAGFIRGAGIALAFWLVCTLARHKHSAQLPPGHSERSRSFLIILLCWMPCWLAYYPAIYSYDGEPQLIQYISGSFDNHHPIFHTLIMGWCYDLGRFLSRILSPQGSSEVIIDGMAIYALAQMLFLAWAFAGAIAALIRAGASRRTARLLTAWFALFPVHPLMAVSTTKDTFFTAFFVLFFVRLWQLVFPAPCSRQKGSAAAPEKANRLCTVLLLTADAVGMMLMRKNGLYIMAGEWMLLAVFPAIEGIKHCHAPVAAVTSGQEASLSGCEESDCADAGTVGGTVPLVSCKAALSLLAALAAAMLIFLCCDHALMRLTNAVQGESAEALSIPLQQIARTYKSNGDSLTPEDMAQITRYVSVTGLNNYRPFISDAVKQNFDNDAFREDPAGFFHIWAKLLARYPGSYGMAFLYHTMGAWYPGDISHTMVYLDWWRDRTGYLITDATPVFALGYMKKENLLPGVRYMYELFATKCIHHRFWLTRVLFSPWLFLFGTVLAAFEAFLGRCRWRIAVITPLIVNYLMVLAGPCVIIRYVYPFMCLLPVYLGCLTLKESG